MSSSVGEMIQSNFDSVLRRNINKEGRGRGIKRVEVGGDRESCVGWSKGNFERCKGAGKGALSKDH